MPKTRRFPWLMSALLLTGTVLPAAAADPAAPAPPTKKAEDKKDRKEEEVPSYSQTVVVTASRAEDTVQDAPVAVTVVSSERLENAPTSNVADALRGVPGLNIVQTSARDFNFTQRGATSTLASGQLALLDGRSIYQDFYGFVMWDVLPIGLDEIDQVEIVRGPASAIWGANALNGVVNVRTKSPREMAGGQVILGAGDVGTYYGSARYAQAVNDRWSFRASGGYYRQDAWERDTTLPSGAPMPATASFRNEGTKQPKFDLRVDFEPSADSRWSFNGGAAFTSGIIHTGIGPFAVDNGTYLGFGQLSYRNKGFDGTMYLNRIDGDAKNLINGIDFAFKSNTWVTDLTQRVALGNHTLVFGATARTNRFDLSIAPLDDKRDEVGGFAEGQLRLGDHVRINLGARVDWFDTIGTTFSPRTSIVLKARENLSFRASYNRAYRAPSLVNNYLQTSVPNLITLPTGPFVFRTSAVGNPDLSEEKVDAFEVGATWTFRNKATFSASVYRNVTKDTIDFYPASFYSPADPPAGWPLPPAVLALLPPLPKNFTYRNVGKVIDRGLELSADVRLTRGVTLNAAYAFQDDPKIEDDDPAAPLQQNLPPRHSYGIGITCSQKGWYASMGAQYTASAFWSDVLDERFWGTTEAFTQINLAAGLKLAGGRVTLGGSVTNVTGSRIKQHIFGDIIGRKFTVEARGKF